MSNLYPIDPKKPILRWGPIPGRLFYMSEFLEVCFEAFPAAFPDFRIPSAVFLLKKGSCLWMHQLDALHASGRKMFQEQILPEDKRRHLYTDWKASLHALEGYFAEVESVDLASLSDQDFEGLWHAFFAASVRFLTPTILPEFGNYGSDALLEERLHNYVQDNTERAQVMEILTAPEALSFYQEEETELEETHDIEAHAQRYMWLKNSYAGTQALPVSFFRERKQELSSRLKEKQEERIKQIRQRKEDAIKRHALSGEIVAMATAIREAIEWQDERKKYIFQTLHYKDILLRHAAKRYGCDYGILLNYRHHEISDLIFSRRSQARPKDRDQGCVIIGILRADGAYDYETQVLSREEMEVLWAYYTVEVVDTGTEEFGGVVACVGKEGVVRGRVNILLDPTELSAFKAGDILVAPMTSPEYVFAMKMASAIITDTGGLTSHAAIVSRELHIPCLVNTKIATHLLKTGDEIEIDTAKGRVRIIQRASIV